ncbi:CyP450 monooxygenase [Fomes fomentarius]|nr:CyP450 monooxygenase [Fomes fomentarius]
MDNSTPVILTALLCALAAVIFVQSLVNWKARTRGRPLPPGPAPLPFVGNLFNVSRIKPWIGYKDLCSKYGDIMHFEVLGQHIVVLGSSDAIFEYLDRRSANTSSRRQTPLIEIVGAQISFAFMPYGQRWRRHRRAFWQYLNPNVVAEHRPIQRAMAHRFLHKVLTDPSQFKKHVRYAFAASIMKVMYNNDVESDIQDQMTWVDESQEGISLGLPPGRFLVDLLPFLRHLPSFFLGPELWLKSPVWRSAAMSHKEVPFARLQEEMKDTGEHNSVVGKLLRRIRRYAHDKTLYEAEEDIVKNVGAIALEGGSDTMFSVVQTTFLAMSLYPNVLKKAQVELDAVVGPSRLPDWDDQESLPYVNAVIKESLRWLNVFPLGLPHCTIADDEFRGYFIQAGTIVLPNTWACMHDADIYEDPETYCPERFLRDGKLDPTVRDPAAYAFGYGRRICPGRHYADAALFINIASALHVFDITPPLDDDGRPVKIEPRMSDGIVTYPEDCRCTIRPRSAQAEALILGARDEAYAGNVC